MTDSELPLLIQQMLEPDFYPHPVQEPIELLQTHISFILLTGEYAYKIKKIVDTLNKSGTGGKLKIVIDLF